MSEEKISRSHSIIAENRKNITVTGVSEVLSFDENTVITVTSMGELTVKGEKLHIAGFNRDSGDLSVDGTVSAFAYTDERKSGGSVFGRIFK